MNDFVCTCTIVSPKNIVIQGNLFACPPLLKYAKARKRGSCIARDLASCMSLKEILFSGMVANGHLLPWNLQDEYDSYCRKRHKRKMIATFFIIKTLDQHMSGCACNVVTTLSQQDIV